jgi:hypothetical protein
MVDTRADATLVVAALNGVSDQVWTIPKVPMEHDGWLILNPRRSVPGWSVQAMSCGEDFMTAAQAREFAAWYLAAADECDRRNAAAQPAREARRIQHNTQEG